MLQSCGVIPMKAKKASGGRLETLRKSGQAIYHKRSSKAAKDGRIRTFKLARGIRLERVVKGKR